MSNRPVDYNRAMDVIQNLGQILSRNYTGEHLRIRDRFWSTFAREMFRQMWRSYLLRSEGMEDDHGTVWEPLKPETVKRKSKAGKRGGRYLPPAKKPSAINIDQGDLLESYAPGALHNDVYVPPPGQLVEFVANGVRLGSRIPYAAAVNRLRALYPQTYTTWVQQAVLRAVEAILPMIENP